MSYSDYGGYAYKNGTRVEDRSDAVITGTAETVPGMYPGLALALQGVDNPSEIIWNNPHGHVVLGDGPLYVGLYKQSSTWSWLGKQELNMREYTDLSPENYYEWGDLDLDKVLGQMIKYALPGGTLYVMYEEDDNYYQYARLDQSDGNVWHGWAGYGVGAGLEDCGYGYSTSEREQRLKDIWEDSVHD